MNNITLEIDATGLNCPLPLLKLKMALNTIRSQEIIKILVTDAAAHLDFGVYCQQCAHEIIAVDKNEHHQVFYIKKA